MAIHMINGMDLDDYLLPTTQTLEEIDQDMDGLNFGENEVAEYASDDDEAYFQEPEIAARWMEDASHRFVRR